MPNNQSWKAEQQLAVDAVRAAGTYLSNLGEKIVDLEEDRDIKLRADKESEAIIMQTLAPSGIPVLAEESGVHGSQSGLRWIIDPIDGTMNFFRGMTDLCCISVGLWDADRPVLGVVYRFSVDELYLGTVGQDATLNGKPIRPSNVATLDRAIYATGYPVRSDYTPEKLLDYVGNVRRFKKIRMLGSAALMGTFVADGRCDVYAEEGIMLWDIAAAVAILTAAGGCYDCEILPDFRCIIRCFANETLRKAFTAAPI